MGLKDKRASLFENINEPIQEDNKIGIQEDKNTRIKEERKKRGYLLTVKNINQLRELNYKFNMDYSDMINEAIEDYYKKRLPE